MIDQPSKAVTNLNSSMYGDGSSSSLAGLTSVQA